MQVGHYFSENLPGAAPQCSVVAALCQCHSAELYVVCCADGKMHGLRTHNEAFFSTITFGPIACPILALVYDFHHSVSFFHKKLCFSDLTQIYPKYDIGRKEFGK